MTEPRTVAIARLEPAAKDQSILTLERSPELEQAHTRAGQYCQLALAEPAVDGHFVLIDPPGANSPARFLLRAGGTAADALRAQKPGTQLTVRGPLGNGFPTELAQGRDVLLVSAGAGIAAIRPLLLTLTPAQRTPPRRVWLYHGTRTLQYVPFARDLATAQQAGTELKVTVAQLPSTEDVVNRVQHALERDKPDLTNAVAFVSGTTAMVDALKVVLPKLGLPAERIALNY